MLKLGLASVCLGVISPKNLFSGVWCGEPFPRDQAPSASFQGPPPPLPTPLAAGSLNLPFRCLSFSERFCGYQAPSYLPVSPSARVWLGMGGAREEKRDVVAMRCM